MRPKKERIVRKAKTALHSKSIALKKTSWVEGLAEIFLL